MGNARSFSRRCDQRVLNFFINWKQKFLHKMEENMDTLQFNICQLDIMAEHLLSWVSKEEDKGRKLSAEALVWISKVEKISSEARSLVDVGTVEVNRLSMSGFCSLISAQSYEYNEKLVLALSEVENLRLERVIEVVPERAPFKRKMPMIQLTESQREFVEEAWNHIMDSDVETLGIYGRSGVGKSTLLKQIRDNLLEDGRDLFDLVIFVAVGVQNIQDGIARSLGLQWGQETEEERAANIFSNLESKRFVLLLDDIWTQVELAKIGVPFPSRENGSKIVFSTCSHEALQRNGVGVQMEVECLDSQEAWKLFRKKVGERTLARIPGISELARIVCRQCHGLPLALTVIAQTMAYKTTLRQWHHAISVLNSHPIAQDSSSRSDQLLLITKCSYENLSGEKTKSCFLYLALFPKDFDIRSVDLINYWVGEELIQHEIQGYEIIDELIRASLLLENESGDGVKMHDFVHDISHFWKHKEHLVLAYGEEVQEMPNVSDWRAVRRMSVTCTSIENINISDSDSDSPQCPNLTTLFLLHNNNLEGISGGSFQWMSHLVVLDLSRNRKLSALPEEISVLVALTYLNLGGTQIKDLPHGLGMLTELIYLNLENTSNLQSITMIPELVNLQVLRFYGSAASLDLSLLKRLERLKDIKDLTVSVSDVNVLKALLGSNLARCTRGLYLKGLKVPAASFSERIDDLRIQEDEGSSFSERIDDLRIKEDEGWVQGLEWENGATRKRICPVITASVSQVQ